LEPITPAEPVLESLRTIEGQIRECFGRVVYSHKTHEKCADILQSMLSSVKTCQIVLSAMIVGGFVSTILGTGPIGSIIGIIISTTLLVMNALLKNYDLGGMIQKHKQTASDLWLIREKYLSLLTDIKAGLKSTEEICSNRDALNNELYSIYSGAPNTNSRAYRKAQEALKINQELTFSDSEIDVFLPKELRRT